MEYVYSVWLCLESLQAFTLNSYRKPLPHQLSYTIKLFIGSESHNIVVLMLAPQQTAFNNSYRAQCCNRSFDSVYNLLIFQEISNECGKEFLTTRFLIFFPLYMQNITDFATYGLIFFYWQQQNISRTWTLLVLIRFHLPFTVGF